MRDHKRTNDLKVSLLAFKKRGYIGSGMARLLMPGSNLENGRP